MLDLDIKQQLTSYMSYLTKPIVITLSLDESSASKELGELATEIASLSTLITLAQGDGNRTPCMSIGSAGLPSRVHFAGIPLGHEFTSLVLALLQSGGHPSKVEMALQQQIRELTGNFNFETYISLSCQNCPDVVQALNLMAVLNPNVTHTMIDGALFQDEVSEKQIMAVPNLYLNGIPFAQGRISLEEILNKVDTKASAKKVEALNEIKPFDVLVIGGGPAGGAAAIYTARKGIRTGVLAERFGGQVLDTVGIENFISVSHTEGSALVANLEQHVKEYGVEIITQQKVAKVTKDSDIIEVELESGAKLFSKALILATGARWRNLNVPGELEYKTKGVAYCPHCDGPFFKGKKVAVVGGGNSGIEAAIDLAGIVEHVTVLEFADTLRADQVLQNKARSMGNIEIITSAMTKEVIGDGSKVTGLTYQDRVSGENRKLDLAGIFVQIGLVPNSEFLKESAINLNRMGEIEIDAKGATSMEGVFAAGDVATTPYKQIIIAMGSGATAALSAFDYLIRKG